MSVEFLKPYLASSHPYLAVNTAEEDRFQKEVIDALGHVYKVYSVAADNRFVHLNDGSDTVESLPLREAINKISTMQRSILLAYDAQHVINNPGIYRTLKNVRKNLVGNNTIILLVAPMWKFSEDFRTECPIIDWDLPTRDELKETLRYVGMCFQRGCERDGEHVDVGIEGNEERLVDAATGLTLWQAENAFALSVNNAQRKFSVDQIFNQKSAMIRHSGLLEVYEPYAPERIGGLTGIKEYFRTEVIPWSNDPLLMVKGILLMGPPGTGKSICARAAGALLGWPVLRMSIGNLKQSLVGASEANMNSALKIADACSPAVLFIDEIEKDTGGVASSAGSDSGTTASMIGRLLTWMSDRTSKVFVVGTCNDYLTIPPEMTRAGRFDERFFVDFPFPAEREQIARIHFERFNCSVTSQIISTVVSMSDGWTGAEIEQLCKSVARLTNRNPSPESLSQAAVNIKPISQVRKEEMTSLRNWGRSTLRIANDVQKPVEAKPRVMGQQPAVNRNPFAGATGLKN